MNFDFFSTSDYKLTRTESILLHNNRLVPLIILFNGLVFTGKSVRLGAREYDLQFGNANCWFLRQWVAWSMGKDSGAMCVIPHGYRFNKVKTFSKGSDSVLPSPLSTTTRFLVRHEDAQPTVPAEQDGFQRLVQEFQPYVKSGGYDSLRLFAGEAYFKEMTKEMDCYNRMVLLPVPVVRRDVAIDKIVYRRSAYRDGEDSGFQEHLLRNGCFFRIDHDQGWIYYSNSKAVFLGLPPTANTLGWPKLPLKDFPNGDYYEVLENGEYCLEGRKEVPRTTEGANQVNSGTN